MNNIPLEPGETLIFEDAIIAKSQHDKPFVFGVTDRSLHFLREKHFAKESWHLERIPLSNVVQVFLRKERRLPLLLFSAILFVPGLIMSAIMLTNALTGQPGTKVSGVPFALVVAGLILPFVSKGRNVLVVQTRDKVHKWKPQLVVDKKSRNRMNELQQNAIDACAKAGLHILRTE
jgi:branched-subunit amino acid transport protein